MGRHRFEVRSFHQDNKYTTICKNANRFLSIDLEQIEMLRVYRLESKDPITNDDLLKFGQLVFSDPVLQSFSFKASRYTFVKNPSYVLDINFRPGVTDSYGKSATDALNLLGYRGIQVYTGNLYYLFGNISFEEAKIIARELIANNLLQHIEVYTFSDFQSLKRFENIEIPKVKLDSSPIVNEISLDLHDRDLLEISRKNCWALNLAELHTIRAYYQRENIKRQRSGWGLPLWPTDVEIEIIAQTWSEHCKHKIFAANIAYSEAPDLNITDASFKLFGKLSINGLYSSYIKASTKEVEKKYKIPWLVSVFSDNAGIVRFDESIDFCIKVETHNSPSALDPYGGALTGILGVNRDILGCGLGAKPVANTNVFCLGPLDIKREDLPQGLKHPRRIMEGVHLGVEDGGNRSGIPTVNGSFYFDTDYSGKPLIFVGTVGVLPHKLPDGRDTATKSPNVGDKVVTIGGGIGKDGIHGATFSSLELDTSSPSTAVQIGDPITQKRVLDFILEARDLGLYSCITDNGAGGISSSVGEMATHTNGATIDLKKAQLKYTGLLPYEIMISESQERMTLAVPPDLLDQFSKLAQERSVNISVLGEFNDSGKLEVFYGDEITAILDLDFLHNGLPAMNLNAHWDGPTSRNIWCQASPTVAFEKGGQFIKKSLHTLLSSPNVKSKEDLVRRYDHEVQAATVVKPFCGKTRKGPANAGVIWCAPHGGSKEVAISISHGMAPKISLYDPYLMAQYAVDEAVRNSVSSGGNPQMTALIDNFCWPDPVESAQTPDGKYKLAQLVRTCIGLYDSALAYGMPFVSGKDSMKNDFRGTGRNDEDIKISVLPTLLVSAIAKIDDVSNAITSDYKNIGDSLYLIGVTASGLGLSEFAHYFSWEGTDFNSPAPISTSENARVYTALYSAFQKGLVHSCHDISEGGMLANIVESMIGSDLGANITIPGHLKEMELMDYLYSEAPGRFVVSISKNDESLFETILESKYFSKIGEISEIASLKLVQSSEVIMEEHLSALEKTWRSGL